MSSPDLRPLLRQALGCDPGSAPASDVIICALDQGLPLDEVAAQLGTADDPAWAEPLELEAADARRRADTVDAVTEALGALAPQVAWAVSPWRPAGGRDVDLIATAAILDDVASALGRDERFVPVPAWDTSGSRAFVRVNAGRIVDLVDVETGNPADIERGNDALGRLTTDALVRRVVERAGRRGPRLADQADLEVLGAPPVTLPTAAPHRARPRLHRTWKVSFSGIDGSGKTTHVWTLADSLERAGIPVTIVWNRPGFQLRRLEQLATVVKRLLREEQRPALARQLDNDESASSARSRRGAVGWAWLLLISLTTVWNGRRATALAATRGGVVIFERHLLDALVDIEWQYPAVRRGFHLALLRRLAPRPDLSVRIVVDPTTAAARNPGDIFRPEHVAAHAAIAERLAPTVGPMLTLDGAAPLAVNRETVLRRVLHGVVGAPLPPPRR